MGILRKIRHQHQAQLQVRDFHAAMDQPVGETPAIRDAELRARLIMEEAAETANALTGASVRWEILGAEAQEGSKGFVAYGVADSLIKPNLASAIDGIADLLYVAYGTAVACGFNVAPYFNEVHRTNLAKANGPVREDGKRLKPEGWTPPNIISILNDEIAKKAR